MGRGPGPYSPRPPTVNVRCRTTPRVTRTAVQRNCAMAVTQLALFLLPWLRTRRNPVPANKSLYKLASAINTGGRWALSQMDIRSVLLSPFAFLSPLQPRIPQGIHRGLSKSIPRPKRITETSPLVQHPSVRQQLRVRLTPSLSTRCYVAGEVRALPRPHAGSLAKRFARRVMAFACIPGTVPWTATGFVAIFSASVAGPRSVGLQPPAKRRY